jgi:hypothetical protein
LLEDLLKDFSGFPGPSEAGIDRIGGVDALQEQAFRPDIGLRNVLISGNNSYRRHIERC